MLSFVFAYCVHPAPHSSISCTAPQSRLNPVSRLVMCFDNNNGCIYIYVCDIYVYVYIYIYIYTHIYIYHIHIYICM
jgi:hypothetical protein